MADHEFAEPRDADGLDRSAWEAICRWPEAAGFDPVFQGMDYAELTRWYLWDKVGRAVRIRQGVPSAQLELALLARHQAHGAGQASSRAVVGSPSSRARASLRSAARAHTVRLSRWLGRRAQRVVYVPRASDRLGATLLGLVGQEGATLVSRQAVDHCNGCIASSGREDRRYWEGPGQRFLADLVPAMLAGLDRQKIELAEVDREVLQAQVPVVVDETWVAQNELRHVRPDVVLVHGDNHPPFQSYVLAARCLGIESIMVQHGLDCERRYLDAAYADTICVWGPERAERYAAHGSSACRTVVTGNPAYDEITVPPTLKPAGDYWLWVTRPHSPEKCYAPSREVDEGVRVFDALIEALRANPTERLVVKPHPHDSVSLLEERLQACRVADRVSISAVPALELTAKAKLVVSEDSTCGLEAMLLGKPLVHAHFAASAPVMPFVSYGAALPGFRAGELASAVDTLVRGDYDQEALQAGQRRFIGDFAGPMDGMGTERVCRQVLG